MERGELIGDEIEVLMAELGEREPIEIPVTVPSGSGGPVGSWTPQPGGGNGQHGNGNGQGVAPPPPPPPPA
jgi:hypothetical protein